MSVGTDAGLDGAAKGSVERIEAGGFAADVAPAIGGSLAGFYSLAVEATPRVDWLRPASRAALLHKIPLGMASFPLVPWCNRIRDGRFEWNGRTVSLPPNADGTRHSIHGLGWLRPWNVAARAAHWIELACEDDGRGAWPFPFAATQRYALDDAGLEITLALWNLGHEPMPAGIGHHPYFAHRHEGRGTIVQAQVDAMWLSDAELLPTALSTIDPAVAALRAGMPIERFALDNNFRGFGREATVRWPDGRGLRLQASEPLDFFVLYTPAEQDVFVMEAVSNCTDWVHLRDTFPSADIGGAALAPGRTLVATTRLLPLPRPSA